MRIVMVEPGGREGVADYTQALVEALAQRGHAIDLVTAGDHAYRPVPGVTAHGLVHYVRDATAAGRLVRRARLGAPVNAARFVAALPRIVALARRADVVHLQGEYFPPLTALLAQAVHRAGVPLVHTAHSTFDRGHAHPRAHATLHRLADRTIVHTRDDVARLGTGAHPEVVPHGEYGGLARTGGEADRGAVRAALGLSDEELAVLLFGQLRPDKGVGDVLAAALEVPGVHVLLAGRELGALAQEAERLAALGARVTVEEGFIAMERAAELFAAADVVALPYRVASQSGVLLLAYGFARPVVAYPVGGLVEAVVDGETGWLTRDASTGALAESLRAAQAAGEPERMRRGAAARGLAQERYAWPVIAERTEAIYADASSARTATE